MARHRVAGSPPPVQTDVSRRPRLQQSPRRAAREAARRSAREQRARRRARGRARRSRHTRVPLGQRLLALPWLTFVLLALVGGAVVGVLRPATFEARSTITASTSQAASRAAVELTRVQLAGQVERQVELEPELRGSVRLAVDRPDPRSVVVVRAQAPDPRLAALAADTAAALVVRGDGELSLTEPAVVPTGPSGGGPWWPWALVGAGALAAAWLVESRHHRRERAAQDQQTAAAADAATAPSAAAGPVVPPVPAPPVEHPVPAGGVR